MAKATIGSSAKVGLMKEKRRTRSNKEYEYDSIIQESDASHVPVMLGEVLEVFSSSRRISSFVDCTLGAAGHSSAVSIWLYLSPLVQFLSLFHFLSLVQILFLILILITLCNR